MGGVLPTIEAHPGSIQNEEAEVEKDGLIMMTDGPARREEIPETMRTETGAPTGREVGVEVRKNTEMALVTMMTIMTIMINIGARRKIGGTIINLLLTTTVIYLIFCIYINVVLFFNVNVKLFP